MGNYLCSPVIMTIHAHAVNHAMIVDLNTVNVSGKISLMNLANH